jgi:hypothetical protein
VYCLILAASLSTDTESESESDTESDTSSVTEYCLILAASLSILSGEFWKPVHTSGSGRSNYDMTGRRPGRCPLVHEHTIQEEATGLLFFTSCLS